MPASLLDEIGENMFDLPPTALIAFKDFQLYYFEVFNQII